MTDEAAAIAINGSSWLGFRRTVRFRICEPLASEGRPTKEAVEALTVRMHGHANERQEPWLLIKERDEAARPASEYSVVEAEPGSVLSDLTLPDKPAKATSLELGGGAIVACEAGDSLRLADVAFPGAAK